MNHEPLWVDPSELISPEEIQIGAQDTYPVINGKCLQCVAWYRVEPGKVTICFLYDGKEQIREFDAKEVSLSGYTSERYSSKNAIPSSDKSPHEVGGENMNKSEFEPLLGSAEIWGDDDFYVRGAISDAAQPLLEYMRAHYPDHKTVLQMDMSGRIIVYQPNVLRHPVARSKTIGEENTVNVSHSFPLLSWPR